MTLYLHNTTIESIIVEQFGTRCVIQPSEIKGIYFEGKEICLKLFHSVSDRLNIGWYLAESIIFLSQMRTALVVDGEYVFKPAFDEITVKIKSREYVFEKYTSYQTFVFAAPDCNIERRRLQVAHEDKIYKKAKFLYLFGGSKSFLMPCGVLVLVLLSTTDFTKGITGDWLETGFWLICFLILFIRYRKSLIFLKKAMDENTILEYLESS